MIHYITQNLLNRFLFCFVKTFNEQIWESTEGYSSWKSSKDAASPRNLVSTIGAQASPKMGGRNQVSVRVSVPCRHATPIAKYTMETTDISMQVKLGIKVIKLVESLIGWKVTVDHGSECRLTFVRGRLHIVEWDPCFDHKTSWMTILSVPRGIPVWAMNNFTRQNREYFFDVHLLSKAGWLSDKCIAFWI